jgi:hypothetical protein
MEPTGRDRDADEREHERRDEASPELKFRSTCGAPGIRLDRER